MDHEIYIEKVCIVIYATRQLILQIINEMYKLMLDLTTEEVQLQYQNKLTRKEQRQDAASLPIHLEMHPAMPGESEITVKVSSKHV